jgi:hypothetical protein
MSIPNEPTPDVTLDVILQEVHERDCTPIGLTADDAAWLNQQLTAAELPGLFARAGRPED